MVWQPHGAVRTQPPPASTEPAPAASWAQKGRFPSGIASSFQVEEGKGQREELTVSSESFSLKIQECHSHFPGVDSSHGCPQRELAVPGFAPFSAFLSFACLCAVRSGRRTLGRCRVSTQPVWGTGSCLPHRDRETGGTALARMALARTALARTLLTVGPPSAEKPGPS